MTEKESLLRREALQDPVLRLERMIEIRLLEDRVKELFSEGVVGGTTHTAQGQEAVAVGLAAVLGPADQVTCTYRGHGMALALGVTPEAVVGEILGRSTGCISGVGGSMHLSDPDVGLMPTFAIVGAGIPVAAGAALAVQVQGRDDVAVSVFGDGTANIGAFHESLNLAAVWKLPVVFVIENNLYGEYSRIERTTPVEDLAVRATSYAMPSAIVDGQDVDEVISAAKQAVDRARAGDGPTLLEMKTYRYAGHSRADAATYRLEGELDAWLQRDPIKILGARLIEQGVIDEREVEDLREHVAERLEAVIDEAKAAGPPDVSEMFKHVYAG